MLLNLHTMRSTPPSMQLYGILIEELHTISSEELLAASCGSKIFPKLLQFILITPSEIAALPS